MGISHLAVSILIIQLELFQYLICAKKNTIYKIVVRFIAFNILFLLSHFAICCYRTRADGDSVSDFFHAHTCSFGPKRIWTSGSPENWQTHRGLDEAVRL